MAEHLWKSPLADKMQEYIRIKKIAGYRFEVERRWLERYDEYCSANGLDAEKSLLKEVVEEFIYGVDYEKSTTRYNKEKVLSGFAKHLCDSGVAAYVCVRKSCPKRNTKPPYIYTEKELGDFFRAVDHYPSHPLTNRHLVDPLLFRMMYGCGLRLGEALLLKLGDVDIKQGTLFIRQAKNNKDRLIPMAESLTRRCGDFARKMHSFHTGAVVFFTSPQGGACDKSTIYRRFREYLWAAGIAHSGHGPRIHDFRHAYCVHCMKRWVLAGKDLMTLLPYLSAYMGHSDFRGTEYYLRLTADLYPEIIGRTEAVLGHLIPDGVSYEQDE